MNSMSKSHNMPGWRIGMLASNAQFVSWILRVKSNIDSGTFRPMQEAAAHALSLPASWYEGNNLIYQERRGIAEKSSKLSAVLSIKTKEACSCGQRFRIM